MKKPTLSGEEQAVKIKRPGTFTSDDERINRKGRPVGSFDPVKAIGLEIANSSISMGLSAKDRKRLKSMGIEIDSKMTMLKAIMIELASSGNPAKLQMYLERTFGKVANINVNQNSTFDFMKHADKFTDAELEAIKDGADPLEILFSKLPSAQEDQEEEK